MAKIKLNKGEKQIVITYEIPEDATDIEKVFDTFIVRHIAHLGAVDQVNDIKELVDTDKLTSFINGIKIERKDAE